MKKTIFVICAVVLLFSMITTPAAASPNITAQAAIVIDYDTGEILYERDAHAMRVPASMTKVLTAFIVYEEIEAGNLTLDTIVTISENTARMTRDPNIQGSRVPLDAGAAYTVDELLHLLMLPSSNGACVALAEHISGSEESFVVLMNETGARLGMKTEFTNSHGSIPHYSTAYSIGILVREFISMYPDILRISSAKTMDHNGTEVNNTNQLIQDGANFYEGADGFKTGTIREAGSCLVSTAVRDGRRIIVVIMNTENNTHRYGDSRTLLDYGFAEAIKRDAERINVVFNGAPLEFDVKPQMIDNKIMIPVRAVFEALGVSTGWDEATGSISATGDGIAINLRIGSTTITVNGKTSELDVPPRIVNDRTLVSIQFIEEALGATVAWTRTTGTVSIKSP